MRGSFFSKGKTTSANKNLEKGMQYNCSNQRKVTGNKTVNLEVKPKKPSSSK